MDERLFWSYSGTAHKRNLKSSIVLVEPKRGWILNKPQYEEVPGMWRPFPYLPIIKIKKLGVNTGKGEGVVLHHGRIVSGTDGLASSLYFASTPVGLRDAVEGYGVIANTGDWYTYDDMTQTSTSYTKEDFNTSPNAPRPGTAGALVPCNGGVAQEIAYSDLDWTVAYGMLTMNASGDIVEDGDTLALEANRPLGVLLYDVAPYVSGRWHSYDIDTNTMVMRKADMVLPFVRTLDYAGSNAVNWFGTSSYEESAVYQYLYHRWAYIWATHDSTISNSFRPNEPLTSDRYGNWVFYNSTGTHNVYITGYYGYSDMAFPKMLEQWISQHPDVGVTGTPTDGVPGYIYWFAHDALYSAHDNSVNTLNASDFTRDSYIKPAVVYDYIKRGYFGLSYFSANTDTYYVTN